MVRLLENDFKIGRLMTIAVAAMAGVALLGWKLGKSSAHSGIALAAGCAAFSLILVSLVGWIIYRGAAARVRAEVALRDSEERFRAMVETRNN